MSRRVRILGMVAGGLAALLLLLVLVGLVVLRTAWFRETVRQKIIASIEDATGGKAEIGAFDFDVSHLHATATHLIIHGREGAGAAPFLRVDEIQVDLRLFTSVTHIVDIHFLGIQHPQANIIIFPDGTSNLPTPKAAGTSNESPLATVVDLAIGRFDLSQGLINFNNHKQALNVSGNNLRALLTWNLLKQSYQGQISLQPLYVVSGRNTPVNFTVTLPLILERDRIAIQNATVASSQSSLRMDASLAGMSNPTTSAHIQGHVALADLRAATDLPISLSAKNVPQSVDLDGNFTFSDNRILVTGLRASLGKSNLEASGALQDPKGGGPLEFKADMALDQLGRLFNVSVRPQGEVLLNGTAKLDVKYAYAVDGNIEAKNVSIVDNGQSVRNLNFFSAVHVDPHLMNLRGIHLSVLGGEFAGNAGLEDYARYRVEGNLRNFDLQQVLHQVAPKQRLPYEGIAGGTIRVNGDTRTAGVKSVVAATRLNIMPGRRGIPVNGRLNVDYRGADDQIAVEDSYIALPHSKLTLSGSVNKQLDIALTSTDLDDLLAAAAMSGAQAPVRLDHGRASFTGTIKGSVTAPHIAGHLAVDHFSAEGRAFTSLQADVAASKSQAAVNNGALTRAAMVSNFAAQVGLRDWSPTANQRLTADLTLRNGDMADILALAGESPAGYAGSLSAEAHISGTVGNPQGRASLQAANGTLDGEPFDRIEGQLNFSDQLVTLPAAFITTGSSRLDMSAEFQHPRTSFSTGHIHAHAQSNPIDLAKIPPLQKEAPTTAGSAQMNVDVTGDMNTAFVLTSVNGQASLRSLKFQGTNYGDLSADARTSGQNVTYSVTSDFTGSTIRVNGSTQLIKDYPTTADASIRNLQIAPLLAVAQPGVPASGKLSGTAHVSGTLQNPQGSVDLDLANAVLYQEPLDHIHARVSYLADSIDVPQFEVVAGPSRITLTAHYDHPATNLEAGKLQFRVNTSRIDLTRIQNLQKLRPGLGGHLQIDGEGAATVRDASPRVLLTSLNASATANGISDGGRNAGDFGVTANTAAAGRLNFALNSNLAGSTIKGSGSAALSGDYPLNAQVSFNNVAWSKLQPIIQPSPGEPPSFDGVVDGQVTVNGPALKTDQLRGSLDLSKLMVTTLPQPGSGAKPVAIQNNGPIQAVLENGAVRLQSLKLTGPKTTIQATGTASLRSGDLNLSVNANADLSVLGNFSQDVESSAGSVVVATTIHGTTSNPLVNGSLELHNAGLHYAGTANGISKANGTIAFNGNSASIRNLTAESGGGKITATGFVGYASKLRFGLHANAANARILIQQGVSVVTNADIHLTGTSDRSLISGNVTIETLSYRPQSDLGSMLTRAAPPVQAPAAPSPLLDNMRLDIHVRTSASMAVQASLAQGLQADADLRVRGTASQPGVLGRVNISEGKLVFFGSTYTVDTGTIGFYNPIRIDPVLDISLGTKAKGVDVVLHVTGPVDNMKLSYTSDPPLQFQEILGLLAAGQTPTSDPTLLANQPAEPPQTFEQMGESALVGKALADPVSSQLQRVFGVSQLKIDPAFTNGSEVPQARLTLQQQISNNMTFTYVSALNDPNSTTVRVEWAFSQQWSAVATRDENGIVSVNLFYKKQFQ